MPRLSQLQLIKDIANSLDNPEPLMRRWGEELLLLTEERFNTETTPAGRPWPPLDPDYKERKRNDSILTETGQMSEQIGFQVEGTTLEVGGTRPSEEVKMSAHNFGVNEAVQVDAHTRTITQAFGRPIEPQEVQVDPYTMHMNIPQREFLGLSREYLRTLKRISIEHILGIG